jgi:hypothetical protein
MLEKIFWREYSYLRRLRKLAQWQAQDVAIGHLVDDRRSGADLRRSSGDCSRRGRHGGCRDRGWGGRRLDGACWSHMSGRGSDSGRRWVRRHWSAGHEGSTSASPAARAIAASVDDGRAVLVIFFLGNPHVLRGAEASQDATANPGAVLALRGSNDLDLHGAWRKSSELSAHAVRNAREHSAAAGEHHVAKHLLAHFNIAPIRGRQQQRPNAPEAYRMMEL